MTRDQRRGRRGRSQRQRRAARRASSARPTAIAQLAVRVLGRRPCPHEAGAPWLDRIETAMTGNQLGNRAHQLLQRRATALAADPDLGAAARGDARTRPARAAIAFTATGQAFDQRRRRSRHRRKQAVDAAELARPRRWRRSTRASARTAPGSAAAAQLADQRDQMLDQMSTLRRYRRHVRRARSRHRPARWCGGYGVRRGKRQRHGRLCAQRPARFVRRPRRRQRHAACR